MNYLRRWMYNSFTASRLRTMLQYGWCPLCNSSPPGPDCFVCEGSSNYGHDVRSLSVMEHWGLRYIKYRRQRWEN